MLLAGGSLWHYFCPTLYWFIHVYPCLSTGESKIFQDILSTFKAKERNWWWLPRKTTSTSSAPLKQPCRTAAFAFPVFPVDDHNNMPSIVGACGIWIRNSLQFPSQSHQRGTETHITNVSGHIRTCCAVHPICAVLGLITSVNGPWRSMEADVAVIPILLYWCTIRWRRDSMICMIISSMLLRTFCIMVLNWDREL